MSYLVLARKYRPQSFKEVVGQDPVSQTLVNALESGRIAHAYVFSGPRGVGKTTTARILAKCLNCEKGPSMTPCDQCSSCRSISQGTSVDDVLEIDGASNRGIEQIRELRESAKYTPNASRYRIFIIDEAHQITKDAFGALLKILEEPPAHVVFMMATTEVQKIPAPILSRCQRFSLRPISPERVLQHLKDICQKEKIKVEDAALADVVRFVEGSMRDALSLLDQAIVYSKESITSQTLRELLGLLPQDVVQNFARDLHANDPAKILQNVHAAISDGIDLTQLGKDLQTHFHNLLLAKAGVEDPFQTQDNSRKSEAAPYSFSTLERNIRLLSRMLDEMRRSETPRAIFEIYALRMGQKVLDARQIVKRLEMLSETGAAPLPPGPSAAPRFSKPAPAPRSVPTAPAVQPKPQPEASMPRTPVMEKKSPPALNLSEHEIKAKWPGFIQAVCDEKLSLGATLEEAQMTLNNRGVVLTFSKNFSKNIVDQSLKSIEPLIHNYWGAAMTFETRFDPEAQAAQPSILKTMPSPVETPPIHADPEVEEETIYDDVPVDSVGDDVKKVMKHFPGTLKREVK